MVAVTVTVDQWIEKGLGRARASDSSHRATTSIAWATTTKTTRQPFHHPDARRK
jgi:hypothetical protein